MPWSSVRVTPASGTTACLGMLVAMYLDIGFRHLGLGLVAKPLIATLDTVALAVAARSARLREPGRAGFFARIHLVVEAPR